MRKSVSLALASVVLVASVLPSLAATVEQVAGKVSHNPGTGFKSVIGSTTGKQGDTVMTRAKSFADIVYDNGCVEHVGADSVVHIRTGEACLSSPSSPATATTPADFTVPVFIGAAAVGAYVLTKPASP
jgi:hypothetical protein